jgi:DNA-binding NtrC family response regulator
MRPIRVLLIDAFSLAPRTDACQRSFDILKDTEQNAVLDISRIQLIELKNETMIPDVMILHGEGELPLQEFRCVVSPSWEAVPLIGAFCGALCLEMIQKALDLGLDDFVTCPVTGPDLVPRLRRLIKANRTTVEPSRTGADFRVESLVGKSPPFRKVVEQIPLLASSKATVLITGETGTGKDLVARAIHAASLSLEKPFVSVNCGALPEHLVESELFGHFKGAFTGASETRVGLIAEAEGGTLFLDEIDTVNPSVQVKLLQFLQDREYRPIGCTKSRRADVRVIAATNTDLRKRVEEKHFREDLFFRLNVLPIHLPALRERIEDILILATYFVGKHAERRVIGAPAFSPGTLQKLMAYVWPGNVRELEGVIQRAVLLSPLLPLQPEAIDIPVSPFGQASQGAFLRNAKAQAIGQFERVYLVNLLATHRGNVSQAAKAAGKERRTFQRLLVKYGLEVGAFRTDTPSSTTD